VSLEVVTFGCRLNALESEAMRDAAGAAGLEDAVLVNTCAVTGEAVRQARQAIRRAARDRPGRPIVVSGCAAQIDPDAFRDLPGVVRVVGNGEKGQAAAYAGPARPVPDIFAAAPAPVAARPLSDRVRAHLAVQTGCDHRCTFCIIPYGRGASRSVPAGEVVRQVQGLVAAGVQEVVLTGVDLTSWGQDLPGAPPLGRLVRRILKGAPDLPRLRLSSIDAAEIDPELLAAFADEPRLMPWLHLSLQHGDDLILKRMKRRHRRADAEALVAQVRAVRPDMAFGADLIAGFPTESEAAFAALLDHVEALDLAAVHAFPFSPRPGAPAARMPQVPGEVIRARAAALRAAGDRARVRHLDRQTGRTVVALVEHGGRARAPDHTEIHWTAAPGTLVALTLTGHDGRRAHAVAADANRLAVP
jgi:threonylcarbamoyladenosine tRNA methylthiotransferase MtaB